MASRKKKDGCTTVRCVKEAIQKCDCSAFAFFHRAAANTGMVNVNRDVALFEKFQKDGITAVPGYALPEYVLEFATTVLAQKSPRNFFKTLRVPYHSPVPAPA
jgi:hypothetical protein